MKELIKKIFAIILILIILVSPYFLIVDFKKNSPVILTVWILSAAYYVFVKSKE